MYSRNTSVWGPSAVEFLKAKKPDIFIFQETHKASDESHDLLASCKGQGYKAVLTPARKSDKSEKAGGVIMGTQEATIPCSRSLRHLAKYEDQAVGQRRSQGFAKGPIDFHDMVVQQICSASGTSLTVVGIYLDASIGLVGQNLVKLHTLAKLLSMVRGPWIVIGDWNATPQELAQIGWLQINGGKILTASNRSYTCTLGQGRMIDYAVISGSAEYLIKEVKADDTGPWKAHYGISVIIDLSAEATQCRMLVLPRPHRHPQAAKKEPDPNSKRSRLRREAADTRRAQSDKEPAQIEPGPREGRQQRVIKFTCPPSLAGLDSDLELEPSSDEDETVQLEPAANSEEQEPEISCRFKGGSAEQLWETCYEDTPEYLPIWAKPSRCIEESIAFRLGPRDAVGLGVRYGRWVTAVEKYFNIQYDIPIEDRRQYEGRGLGVKTRIGHVRPKVSFQYSDTAVTWWSTVAAWAQELEHSVQHGFVERATEVRKRLVDAAGNIPISSHMPLPPRPRDKWTRSLRSAGEWSGQYLAEASAKLQTMADRGARSLGRTNQLNFDEWLEKAHKNTPGMLHRLIKDRTAEVSEVHEQGSVPPHRRDGGNICFLSLPTAGAGHHEQGETTCDRVQLMDNKAKLWSNKWQGTLEWDRLKGLFGRCREQAREFPREPLTDERLQTVFRHTPEKKAKGVDMMGSGDFRRLPAGARKVLLELYDSVESRVAWPWQTLTALINLHRKPSGDDRSIGILTMFCRVWCAARSEWPADWTRQRAGAWDTAVAGSSAIRVALLRAFRDETISLGGTSELAAASFLWDIEGFYDALDPVLILEEGLKVGFPPQTLAMEMLLHLTARFLKDEGACSEAVHAIISILAGARSAVDFSRCVLYSLMEKITIGNPTVMATSWVDDVVQRAEGLKQRVLEDLVGAGVQFFEGCKRLKLKVASKSTVISTNRQLALDLSEAMSSRGVTVKASRVAADLGIDRGAVRRAKPKHAARRQAAARKFTRINKLVGKKARLRKMGIRLALSGAIPQETYAGRVFGTAPSALAIRRRRLGKLMLPTFGRCLDTVLQLELGRGDPAFATVFEILEGWIDILAVADLRTRAKSAWKKVVLKLKSRTRRGRWMAVTGTTHAMVATLLDLGWDPVGPWHWVSDSGQVYKAQEDQLTGDREDWSDLKEALASSIEQQLWKRASKHYQGGGLEEGADTTRLRRYLKRLGKKGDSRRRAAALTVATGGAWTRTRLQDHGMDIDTVTCQRCDQGAAETPLHRYYKCPANDCLANCKNSEPLAQRAIRTAEDQPAVWYRGLIPSGWTAVPDPPEEPETFEWGAAPEPSCWLEGVQFGSGDGAGTAGCTDPRLQRFTWASVAFDMSQASQGLGEAQPVCMRGGGVQGKQSVNRAEAMALRGFLGMCNGGAAVYVTDSSYVDKGVRKVQKGQLPRTHRDVWKEIATRLRDLHLVVVSVNSHLTAAQYQELGQHPVYVWMNGVADLLAGQIAKKVALPEHRAMSIDFAEGIGMSILRRLTEIQLDVQEKDIRTRPPPKPRTKRIRDSWGQSLRQSDHKITRTTAGWKCGACLAVGSSRRAVKTWIAAPCTPAVQRGLQTAATKVRVGWQDIHESHNAVYNQETGTYYCEKCGCTGKKMLRGLAKPCSGRLNRYGRQNKAKIAAGEAPGTSSSTGPKAFTKAYKPRRRKRCW